MHIHLGNPPKYQRTSVHYIVEEGHPKTYEILKQYLKLFDKIIDRQIQRKSSKVFGRVEIHHNPEKAKKKKKKKERSSIYTYKLL